ncbi:MAG: sigma-70 family RNA polymerase sigma factor [Xanthobacteraceae bacterium]
MTDTGVSDAPDDLVPLRRKRRNGAPYYRRPVFAAEVQKALQRPMQELLSKTSPASTECLLYFLRNFRPNGGPSPIYQAILLEFLARVDKRIVKRTGGITQDRRTEIRQDLQLWFIERIATGSDILDVFEFAFNLAIKGKIIDAIRRYQTRDAVEVPASAFDGDEETEEGGGAGVFAARSSLHERRQAETLVELQEALDQLTDKERRAVWATEHLGLDQDEAGGLMGVSSRRVRQLLKSARDKLAAMKKGAEQ